MSVTGLGGDVARARLAGHRGAAEPERDEHLGHPALRADGAGVDRPEGRQRLLLAQLERLHVPQQLVVERARRARAARRCGRRSGPCASSAIERPPAASAASTAGPRSPPRCVPACTQVAPRSAGAAQPVMSSSLQATPRPASAWSRSPSGAVAQLALHDARVEPQAERRGQLGDRRGQRRVVAARRDPGPHAQGRERARGEQRRRRPGCARARARAGTRRPARSIRRSPRSWRGRIRAWRRVERDMRRATSVPAARRRAAAGPRARRRRCACSAPASRSGRSACSRPRSTADTAVVVLIVGWSLIAVALLVLAARHAARAQPASTCPLLGRGRRARHGAARWRCAASASCCSRSRSSCSGR